MIIEWDKIADIIESVYNFAGAWPVVLGILLCFYKYTKNVGVFIKDMVLAPIRVKNMMVELKFNGGASVKDSLLRIENRQISNEQKLTHVLDSTGNGSFEMNADGRIIKVSRGYCHITERSEE